MSTNLAELTGIDVPTRLLIGGEWTGGRGGGTMPVIDPATEDALTGPPVRITTPHIPLPAADALEDHVLPSVARITQTVRETLEDA